MLLDIKCDEHNTFLVHGERHIESPLGRTEFKCPIKHCPTHVFVVVNEIATWGQFVSAGKGRVQ